MRNETSMMLLMTLALAACSRETNAAAPASAALQTAAKAEANEEEKEEVVPVDAVPAHVKAAALAAVPGLVVTRAEREVEKGVVIYDLEGAAAGVAYEVEVTADGKVTEIEKDDDDDDDDGDDDDK